MATKNNRRILITKRILKESLLELMTEKPIARISVKEICERSEMSRSTFYLHYQDPYELLAEIEGEALSDTVSALGSMGSAFGSKESILRFLQYLRENKGTFGVLLCQEESGTFQQVIMEKIAEQIQSSIPDLQEGADASYKLAFLMNGSLQVIKRWIQSDFDIPAEDLAVLILQLCTGTAMTGGF